MKVLLLNKVEHIVAKEENGGFEQFSSLVTMFAAEASESIYMWERAKPFPHTTNLQRMKFKISRKKYEKICVIESATLYNH